LRTNRAERSGVARARPRADRHRFAPAQLPDWRLSVGDPLERGAPTSFSVPRINPPSTRTEGPLCAPTAPRPTTANIPAAPARSGQRNRGKRSSTVRRSVQPLVCLISDTSLVSRFFGPPRGVMRGRTHPG
jgi:hypothetical protein